MACHLGSHYYPGALSLSSHIEAKSKWTPFSRHFQTHFLEWNVWIVVSILLKFVTGSDNSLVPDGAQAIIGINDGLFYWCIYASFGLNGLSPCNSFEDQPPPLPPPPPPCRWNLWVPDIQISCRDLTTCQGSRIVAVAPVLTARHYFQWVNCAEWYAFLKLLEMYINPTYGTWPPKNNGSKSPINSLTPGRCNWRLKYVIFKYTIATDMLGHSHCITMTS